MKREPLVTAGVIGALIAAGLTLLTEFGVALTAGQQQAINQFVAILAPVIVALVGRLFVTPVSDPRDKDGFPLYSYESAQRTFGGK